MKIPEKILKKWEVLRSPGDSEKLAERIPGSTPETFQRAFRERKCRDEVFEAMAAFYQEKSDLVKQYL
jgi:hypothetical protein